MVPVADRPECRIALDHAFRLAAALPANIVGYHLRPHRAEHHASGSAILPLSVEQTELPEPSAADLKLNSAHAEQLFRLMAREHGIPIARKPRRADHPLAFWNEMVGTPERLFGIIGPTSDCIVVSRPKRKASGPARAFLLAALLNAGKPLLIVPQRAVKAPGKRILVAWNQGPHAAAALTAALPLLGRAEQVHIVCCGKEELPGPKSVHVRNYLLHWGIESQLHQRNGRKPAAEILKVYKANRCDLLVMGAYSRGQLRQRILGGVTHEMLTEHDVPVFALHS
jgi:nucleotide-binding universal stress UspA family protein